MKKQLWIPLALLFIIAITLLVINSNQATQPEYGMIVSDTPPPVEEPPPAEVTPPPVKLSPEEQDKLPGGMFKRTVTEADYVLAGINFFKDKANDIIAKHGQPLSKKKDSNNCWIWYYPNFNIYFELGDTADTAIYEIKTNYGKIPTARGIQIGDPIGKVIEKYGIPFYGSVEYKGQPLSGRNFFLYSANKKFFYNIDVIFSTNNEIVTEISIKNALP